MPTTIDAHAGQAVYTPRTLRAYDAVVLGISNRWIWKCPTAGLLEHYNAHVSSNHLDVGVGSGYFPDRCRFPVAEPRLALMDLNGDALAYAANRVAQYRPETYVRNVLEPIPFEKSKFDSVALNYVFHCVPGSIAEKAIAVDHLIELTNPGAVVFGSTLVQGDVPRSWAARWLMAFYNHRGIFANVHDTRADLETALADRLEDVQTRTVGCGVLFSGRVPGS